MTFTRALYVGLLGLGVVVLAILLGGCATLTHVPDACLGWGADINSCGVLQR